MNKMKCKYWSPLAIVGFAAGLLYPPPAFAVAPPLGAVQQFGVLANSGVTAAGTAVVNGDVGSCPTPSITGAGLSTVPPFIIHPAADAVVCQAQTDATAASTNLLGQGPGTTIVAELGGTTRGPGVYTFSSTANIANGTTFTLSGAGSYIFLVGSAITANTLSNVALIDVDPCQVFWRVGSDATLNGLNFPGTVIAGAAGAGSVTVGTGANLAGRAVSLTAAVTMPGTGQTIGGCSGVVPPVPPPGGVALSKAFVPPTIGPGGVSTLTIVLSNANAGAVALISDLVDNLPNGVTTVGSPTTTCGGTPPTATTSSVTLPIGATIPGGAPGTCTVTVNVTATSLGFHPNTLGIGALVTNAPIPSNPDAASGTLSVAVIPGSSIPTLSEWAQLGMVLILVGVAVWHLRRRRAPVSA